MGLSLRQVSRWEKSLGDATKTNSESLLKAIVFLNADFETIERLLASHEDMTDEEIKVVMSPQSVREKAADYSPLAEYTQEAQRRVEWLYNRSPKLVKQFLDYGKFLEEHT
jgi:hypothetical protein